MRQILAAIVLVLWASSGGPFAVAGSASTAELLSSITQVSRDGEGHAKAAAAVKELQQAEPPALLEILAAHDGINPLAANWLRGAAETIVDRAIAAGKELPRDELQLYVAKRTNDQRARRLAYECLLKVDPEAKAMVPDMLDDPSSAFRRDAVEYWMGEAAKQKEAGDQAAATATYEKALYGAYDDDQVRTIAEALKALGKDVDLQQHFGFVTKWAVIGPFDSTGGKGFAEAYPPESEFKRDAEYDGKDGKVTWQEIGTEDPYGVINIAKQIAAHKGAVMYLATEIESAKEQTVQLRLGTPNSWKVWNNGEFLFGREEYHRGMEIDQYKIDAKLKPGKNLVLLKICQNEQTEDWAQRYEFQMRVCDASGTAVLPPSEATAARESR